jgi:hypothetical protein
MILEFERLAGSLFDIIKHIVTKGQQERSLLPSIMLQVCYLTKLEALFNFDTTKYFTAPEKTTTLQNKYLYYSIKTTYN